MSPNSSNRIGQPARAPLLHESAIKSKRHQPDIILSSEEHSRAPTSTARKVGQAFLIIPKLLCSSVTIPLCSALEAISGFATGMILGAVGTLNVLKYGGLKLALPLSLLIIPASMALGVGIAIMGLFVGVYDGAHLGWGFDHTKLQNTYHTVEQRIQDLSS